MILSCLIVDDEPSAVSVLTKHIAKIPYLSIVFTTNNPAEASTYLSENRVTIVFSDIQMSEISGIDLLQLYTTQTHFILTTGFREYALEGYEHGAIDYLVKPVTFERLLKAVQRVCSRYLDQVPLNTPFPVDQLSETQPADVSPVKYLFLKTDKGIVKIEVADICYVQAQEHYVKIYDKGKFILCHLSLQAIEKKLPEEQFIRISRSIVVAIRQINCIRYDEITLHQPSGTIVKVGTTYKEKLLKLADTVN